MYIWKGLISSVLLSAGIPATLSVRVPNSETQTIHHRAPTPNATTGPALTPRAVYNGGYEDAQDIRIRIANGGAGQSGPIGAWADAFIKYCVEERKAKPFQVGWYLGDTTESLGFLSAGSVDIAVTYSKAQSLGSGAAAQSVYGFRDHFLLVGPKSNPAQLDTENDDILSMFNKIVTSGNTDIATPPDNRTSTRFLSRFDKSATNIKESELFITIGQALAYSKWYHQYPVFPLQALAGASVLSEYTITDRGTWLSSPASVTAALQIYKAGSDNAQDPLLNPAHVLLGSRTADAEMPKLFMEWVAMKTGGQKVIREFEKGGEVLYSEAPESE